MPDSPIDTPREPSPDEVLLAKARAREAGKAARSSMDETARRSANRAIAHAALGLWDLHGAHTVLAYMATTDEVDPYPIVEALRIRGVRVVLPRIDEPAGLALHAVEDDSVLVYGPFGILEPDLRAPRVQPHEVDAAFVPGVAFDTDGNRVGYGGGFYDRLLPILRGECPRIGLAFDEQVVESLPLQPHDRPMDAVVTQTTVHRRPVPETPLADTPDEV